MNEATETNPPFNEPSSAVLTQACPDETRFASFSILFDLSNNYIYIVTPIFRTEHVVLSQLELLEVGQLELSHATLLPPQFEF